jgi:hypothetical protein
MVENNFEAMPLDEISESTKKSLRIWIIGLCTWTLTTVAWWISAVINGLLNYSYTVIAIACTVILIAVAFSAGSRYESHRRITRK